MAKSLVLDQGLEPIAGYTLVRLLGRGGFGEVWEARAPGDFHVALKFLRLDTLEAGVEQRALEVIRNIRHGHLLDVQFATRVADCLVIAMPLCDQSLMDRLRACQTEGRPGVPRNELLRHMDELARAVDYLNEPRHRAEDGNLVGVQHRDIKPHNIFLVGGSVRLADFGLAKILSATVASTRGSMTASHAAPEVIQGHFSRWSDQYSLAATYCELRTGQPPFVGENPIQVIYAHVNRPPELADIPEEERKVVARALAKRPEERWPTCCEFVRALIAAAREDNRRATAPAPAEPPAPGVTKLLETQVPPPIPPTRIDDGSSSRLAAVATGLRPYWLWLFSLAAVLAGLAAVLVLSRLGPSPSPTAVKPDPPSTASTKPAPEPAKPQPIVPAEPPKPIPSDPGPIAEAPAPVPAEPAKPITPRPVPVEPTPVPAEPPKRITNSIGMKLVLIPAGEYLMGSPASDKDAEDDEKPQHRVRLTRPFYLGATEVTVGQFRRVAEKTRYRTEAEKDGKGGYGWNEAKGEFEQGPKYTWRNPGFAQTDEHPVVNVSWNDAVAYCNMLNEVEGLKPEYGYRLPTEAEWEYACRARTTTRYASGDDPETLVAVGNIADGTAKAKYPTWTTIAARDGYVYAAPVSQFRPNAFNLYDMHGNVWEWCQDWYDKDYYSQSPDLDPLGPPQAAFRVNRGGPRSLPLVTRSANRNRNTPANRNNNVGFRVARAQRVR